MPRRQHHASNWRVHPQMIIPQGYIELTDAEYVQLAFEKLASITASIVNGGRPAGQINLFAHPPSGRNLDNVVDPRLDVCQKIIMMFNRQWIELLDAALTHSEVTEVRGYTFKAEYRQTCPPGRTSPARGTVIVLFYPIVPDCSERSFSPD